MSACSSEILKAFLLDRLGLDEKLEFFTHLECCWSCRETLYACIRAQHPHYYRPRRWVRKKARRVA